MNSFRTILPSFQADFKIDHQNRILSLGSCFAEHISERLTALKFPTCLNPFGILYNPISIHQTLESLLEKRLLAEEDLFYHDGLWHSFAHHGSFSKADKKSSLELINTNISEGHQFLKKTDRLLLTFGTANVFELMEEQKIVANCHKLPGQNFERKRLTVQEIIKPFKGVFEKLKGSSPLLEIIVTVSPVRHIRDGLVGNQKSKATLLLALDELVEQFDFVHYFPSYELVLDDLRDYRFYNVDMIHPSNTAIEYVWRYFERAYFEEPTLNLNKRIEKIVKASNHRPLHPDADTYKIFLSAHLEKIKQLKKEFPFLDFETESKAFH